MWILRPAEDSLETLSPIFAEKKIKKYLWTSSAAVVIGASRVKVEECIQIVIYICSNDYLPLETW